MLDALGATRIRLLSNNPDKGAQLEALGIDVIEQVPTGVHLSAANLGYLTAKRDHTAHTLELPQTAVVPSAHGNDGRIPTHAEMLERIDEMVPRLRLRAEETERLRRLPEDTVAELKDAGVFQVLTPKTAGGYGMGVETYVEVIRRLARGDASTAWTAGHLIEHVWMLARWPRRVQDEVFTNGPAPLAAATSAPVGLARKVTGGYAITGHWSFASGIMHSEWALLAAQAGDVRLQCLVPVAGLELLDVWHTDGLRGTGSNDLRAKELFVPEYRAMDWSRLSAPDNPGSKIHSDPLIHSPMSTLLNMVAPAAALGSAEYAINLFQERMLVPKEKNALQNRQAESPLAQARFARAYGLVATARLHWHEAVQLVVASQKNPSSPMTDRQKAHYRLSLALSGEAAQEAVRLITAASGGSAHRLSNPLQRIQRDMNVLLSHPTLSADPILEHAGRGLLGMSFTAASF